MPKKALTIRYIFLSSLIWLSACSATQQASTKPTSPEIIKPISSAFIIPAMRLLPVANQQNLNIIEANSDGKLSIKYRGKAFPKLTNINFIGSYLKGFVNVTKIINGLTLSKQLINTPLKITHFATDADGEIYIIITQQQVYKFAP